MRISHLIAEQEQLIASARAGTDGTEHSMREIVRHLRQQNDRHEDFLSTLANERRDHRRQLEAHHTRWDARYRKGLLVHTATMVLVSCISLEALLASINAQARLDRASAIAAIETTTHDVGVRGAVEEQGIRKPVPATPDIPDRSTAADEDEAGAPTGDARYSFRPDQSFSKP